MTLTAILLAILPFSVTAFETGITPQAMLYVSLPLDGKADQGEALSFGLRLDAVYRDELESPVELTSLLRRPASLDFRFGSTGMQSLVVSGIDYLALYRAARQNEGDDEDYDDQVSVTDSIRGVISDMQDVAPLGIWMGGVLGVVLITGVGD